MKIWIFLKVFLNHPQRIKVKIVNNRNGESKVLLKII